LTRKNALLVIIDKSGDKVTNGIVGDSHVHR
jgi:hypothetical protein